VANRAAIRSTGGVGGSHLSDRSSDPGRDAASLALLATSSDVAPLAPGGGRENLTPYEEIQLIRRQGRELPITGITSGMFNLFQLLPYLVPGQHKINEGIIYCSFQV
jgi:hypothetical protein